MMRALIVLAFIALAPTLWARPSADVYTWGEMREESLDSTFKLCFWNILKLSRPGSHEDLAWLRAQSDLLLIQEAQEGEDMGRAGTFARSWGKTGVATLSDIRPKSSTRLLSNAYEFGLFTPKVILLSLFELKSGEELLVANIHALNFVTNALFKEQLEMLVEALSSHQGQIIVAGDFNTWSQQRLHMSRTLLGNLGLSEIHFYPERPMDPRQGTFGLLDRAFSRGLLVSEFEVLGDITSSDHFPSCARFEAL